MVGDDRYNEERGGYKVRETMMPTLDESSVRKCHR